MYQAPVPNPPTSVFNASEFTTSNVAVTQSYLQSNYLPLAGGTMTGTLSGTTFSGSTLISSSNLIEASTLSTTVALSSVTSLYGTQLKSVLSATNGIKPGSSIAFNNSTTDTIPLSAIVLDKIGTTEGNLVFNVRNGTNLTEVLRLTSTGLTVLGSASDLSSLSGVIPGLVAASKSLIVDSSKNLTNLNRLNLTSQDNTGLSSTTNCAACVLNILSGVGANGQYQSSTIAFRNDSGVDFIADSLISLDRKSSTSADLVFITRTTANNLSEVLRVCHDPAININYSTNVPAATINATGNSAFVDGSYNRLLRLEGSNATPVQFEIQCHSGTAATATNAAFIGTISNNNLSFGVNDSTKMTLDTNGRLGIATTSPVCPLEVKGNVVITYNTGSALYSVLSSTSSLTSQSSPGGVSTNSGCKIEYDGIFRAVYCISDERIKTEIKPLTDDYIDKLYNVNTYMYKFKDGDNGLNVGFISQEFVKNGIHEVLSFSPNEKLKKSCEYDVDDVQIEINYSSVSVLNFALIKKQKNKIDELEKENQKIKDDHDKMTNEHNEIMKAHLSMTNKINYLEQTLFNMLKSYKPLNNAYSKLISDEKIL